MRCFGDDKGKILKLVTTLVAKKEEGKEITPEQQAFADHFSGCKGCREIFYTRYWEYLANRAFAHLTKKPFTGEENYVEDIGL